MVDEPNQPSLSLLLVQVAAERETIRSHAENLDAKAGVVLGFAGILVGLGATAQSVVAGGLTVLCLALAAILIVVGTLLAAGGRLHA